MRKNGKDYTCVVDFAHSKAYISKGQVVTVTHVYFDPTKNCSSVSIVNPDYHEGEPYPPFEIAIPLDAFKFCFSLPRTKNECKRIT